MFEAAEIKHQVPDKQYGKQVPQLREALLDAQYDMLEAAEKGVIILVGGVEGAGKGDTINLLQTWLDPRHAWVHPFSRRDEHERRYPRYQRYWAALPPRGRTSIFFGSWYTDPVIDHVFESIDQKTLDGELYRIRHFEKMLVDEGYVLLKLWFHLSKKQQKQRLQKLSKDPKNAWRVTERDWRFFEKYDRFVSVGTRALRQTGTEHAPWTLIAGAEPNYRHLEVGRVVLQTLKTPPATPEPTPRSLVATVPPPDQRLVLDTVDLDARLDKPEYKQELEKYQRRLALAVRDPWFAEHGLVAVFEGWDAAGKGGAIRRVTAALDARRYQVKPIAAPSDEERARPYLWRFWRNVPPHGRAQIFDRSWYGRVLVERVEGYASEVDWMRAYTEINDFEEALHRHGLKVCKFWLHIDPDEQLRRFEARKKTGFKRHKLTAEDWRNRDKWQAYEEAVHDMVERTSTELAPWTLVAANDKRHARIQVLRTLVDCLEGAIEQDRGEKQGH